MRKTIVACTATCTIAWGLSFSVMKILLNIIDPMQILALRWLLAAIIFGVMVVMGKIRINLRSKLLKYALLAGLMEPCIYSILEIYGVDLMSASLSALFIATIPSMTLLIGAGLFHRKINKLNAIGIVLAFIGVTIATVFVPGFSISGTALGVIVMIGAVVSAVFFSFSNVKASKEIDAKAMTFVMAVMGAVTFNLISLFMGYGTGTYIAVFTDWRVALGILFLGVGCSVFGYFTFNKLLALIDTSVANSFAGNLTTVIGVIGGIIVAGDQWGIATLIGMLLTVTGVWLSSKTIES